MPVRKLSYLLASRVGTLIWHEKNDQVRSDGHKRQITEIEALCREFMPSGSGFDAGTKLVLSASTPARLVFQTSFHHMDEHGGYDGWTEHRVYVTSQFDGMGFTVGGKDRNGIKDYIADAIQSSLEQQIDQIWDDTEKEMSFHLQR